METSYRYLSSIDTAALQRLYKQGLRGDIGSTFVICHHPDVEYYVRLHFRSNGPTFMYDGRSFYPMELPLDPRPVRVSLTGLRSEDSQPPLHKWAPIMISVGLRSGFVLESSDPYATAHLKEAHLLAASGAVMSYDACCHAAVKANLVDDVTIHMPTVIERMSAVVLGVQSGPETALMDRLRDAAPSRAIMATWYARVSRANALEKDIEV